MANAEALVAEIRNELAAVDQEIKTHDYPARFESGNAPIEALVPFVASEWYIAQSDLRSFALMTQRFGADPGRRDFFHGIYRTEDRAVTGLFRLAHRLGLEEDILRTYDLDHRAFGYAAYVAWSAQYARAGTVATAILVNFDSWGHNCGRLRDALEGHYGLSEEETMYLASFADLEPDEERTRNMLQADLDRGLEPATVRRVARLYQGYELDFWNAVERLAVRGSGLR